MSPATALAPIPPPPGATSSEADLIRLALAMADDLLAARQPGAAREHLIRLAEIRANIANRDVLAGVFAGATSSPAACGCGGHHPSALCGYGDDAALDERPARLPTLGGEALGCSIRGREPREASVALDGHLTDGMRDEEGWHVTDRKPPTARPVEMGAAWSRGDAGPVRPGVAAMCGHPLADGRYRPVIGPGMAADAACGEPAGYGMPPAEVGGELDGEV